jgi:hypothetical protein
MTMAERDGRGREVINAATGFEGEHSPQRLRIRFFDEDAKAH